MIDHFINRLNRRTITFSAIAAFILIILILDRLLFSPLYHSMKKLDEELSLKKDLAIKYYSVINKKGLYEKKLNELRTSSNSIEKRFFSGKTVDLAQARLQEYVKKVARRNGLIVSRSSAKKGKVINEESNLMLVYATFELNDVDRIKKIQSFLYNIEYENEKLILVDELKIRGTGFNKSSGVSAFVTLFTIAKLGAKT